MKISLIIFVISVSKSCPDEDFQRVTGARSKLKKRCFCNKPSIGGRKTNSNEVYGIKNGEILKGEFSSEFFSHVMNHSFESDCMPQREVIE